MLTILLVGELGSRFDNLGDLLAQAGHAVERIPSHRLLHLDSIIEVLQPHLVLIDYSDPMRDSVEQFCVTPYDADSPMHGNANCAIKSMNCNKNSKTAVMSSEPRIF
jgi:AmiR/NasT family two-component response regulator